jgi:hypothetical protein
VDVKLLPGSTPLLVRQAAWVAAIEFRLFSACGWFRVPVMVRMVFSTVCAQVIPKQLNYIIIFKYLKQVIYKQ